MLSRNHPYSPYNFVSQSAKWHFHIFSLLKPHGLLPNPHLQLVTSFAVLLRQVNQSEENLYKHLQSIHHSTCMYDCTVCFASCEDVRAKEERRASHSPSKFTKINPLQPLTVHLVLQTKTLWQQQDEALCASDRGN